MIICNWLFSLHVAEHAAVNRRVVRSSRTSGARNRNNRTVGCCGFYYVLDFSVNFVFAVAAEYLRWGEVEYDYNLILPKVDAVHKVLYEHIFFSEACVGAELYAAKKVGYTAV